MNQINGFQHSRIEASINDTYRFKKLKRITSIDTIQLKLDEKLDRNTQFTFGMWVKDRIIEAQALHGREALELKKVPSNYYWVDVVKFFLYKLVTNDTQRSYELLFGIPKIIQSRMRDFILHKATGFPKQFISWGSLRQRKKYSLQQFLPDDPYRNLKSLITGRIDGRAFSIVKPDNAYWKDYYCYKSNAAKFALNNLCTQNMRGEWISYTLESQPFNINQDSPLFLKQHFDEFKQHIHLNSERIVADGSYRKYSHRIRNGRPDPEFIGLIVPEIKTNLSPQGTIINEFLQTQRKEIEDSFGLLVHRFPIIGSQSSLYRDPVEEHAEFLGIVLALDNLHRFPDLRLLSEDHIEYNDFFGKTTYDYNPNNRIEGVFQQEGEEAATGNLEDLLYLSNTQDDDNEEEEEDEETNQFSENDAITALTDLQDTTDLLDDSYFDEPLTNRTTPQHTFFDNSSEEEEDPNIARTPLSSKRSQNFQFETITTDMEARGEMERAKRTRSTRKKKVISSDSD